jgi:hypothetical protein
VLVRIVRETAVSYRMNGMALTGGFPQEMPQD